MIDTCENTMSETTMGDGGIDARPNAKRSRRRALLAPVAAVLFAAGCASAGTPPPAATAEAGSEIWSVTCDRCHNARPGTQFTAEEWPVIVNHMRTRAHLTRSEAAAVTAFLRELAEPM